MAFDIAALTSAELSALADQLTFARQTEQLTAVLARLCELEPKAFIHFRRLGFAELAGGRGPAAEAALKKAAALKDPERAMVDAGLGLARRLQDDDAGAAVSLKRAALAGYRPALTPLVECLNGTGQLQEALQVVARLLKASPMDADLLMTVARQYAALQRFKDAVAPATQALSLNAGTGVDFDFLAQMMAAAGDTEGAMRVLYQRLAADFESADGHGIFTQCLTAGFTPDQAKDVLRRAIAQDAGNATAHFQLSLACERDAALEEAEAAARQALALRPSSNLVKGLLARVCLERRKPDEAIALFNDVWDDTWATLSKNPRAPTTEPVPPPGPLEPLVYLPIEIRSRELHARFLLIQFLARAGFIPVVLGHGAFRLSVTQLPRGIVVYKSINGLDRQWIQDATRAGHRVTVIDEEAFGWTQDSFAIMRVMDRQSLPRCSALFAPGQHYCDQVAAAVPEARDILLHTGNPRTDLYEAPRIRAQFDAEAAALRDELGSNILVCTNFGGWNAASLTWEAICRTALIAAGLDLASDDGRRLLALHKDDTFAECRNTMALVGAIPALAAAFPERTIVIRPHPSERTLIWDMLATEAPNIRVMKQGSLLAQMTAADAVIHLPGCGTGLESRLLQRPTISYNRVADLAYPKLGLSGFVSPTAGDVPALLALVRRAIDDPAGLVAEGRVHDAAVDAHVARSPELVSVQIARHLAALYARAPGAEPLGARPPRKLLERLNEVLRSARAKADAAELSNMVLRTKRLDLPRAEVADILKDVGARLDQPDDLKVASPAPGMFVIHT